MNTSSSLNQTVPHSPVPDMDNMNDDEVKQLIAEGYKLLNRRKRERAKMVKEQIKKMAAKAGINVSFSAKAEK